MSTAGGAAKMDVMNGNCMITRPELVRVGDETVLRLGAEQFEYDAEMEEAFVPKAMLKGFRLSDIPKELTIKAVEDHGVINHDDFALSSFADGSASAWVELSERRKLWDGDVGLSAYVEAVRRAIAERDDAEENDFSDDGDYIFLHYEITVNEDLDIQNAISRVEGIIGDIEVRAEQLARQKVSGTPKLKMVEVGRVAVDSGQIMILDPCRKVDYNRVMRERYGMEPDELYRQYREWNNEQRQQWHGEHQPQKFVQIKDDKDGSDSTYGAEAPLAVVSASGFGDGIYPVYAEIVDCEELGPRVAKLTIDFELGPMSELFVEMCHQQAKEKSANEPSPGMADSASEIAGGSAVILTDRAETTVYFHNALIGDSQVMVGFHQSHDAYSVCLFINMVMIACDHGATWEQAMAYIFHVLSARTAEEAAKVYGQIHPRFTADELIARVRNPNWESEFNEKTEAA